MTDETPARLTRVTVNLVPRAVRALDSAAELDGYTKTEIINRSLQLYDFVTTRTANGDGFVLRHPDGSFTSVTLL